MAISQVHGGVWFPAPWQSTDSVSPSFQTLQLDAAGEKAAHIFTVPKTGTLDTFEFRISAVANNPDNGLRISFQNLDANGDPDGTQDQFRDIAGPFSANTWIVPGLITSDGTDTGVKRSVTAGDRLAVVIEFVSFVAGDSIQISMQTNVSSATERLDGSEFYSDHFTAAWAKSNLGLPLGALKYATSGYFPMNGWSFPVLTGNARLINTGSTPDEIALRFQVPFDCECDGAWVRLDMDGDAEIVLYSGTTVLKTATLDASARLSTSGANVFVRWAPEALTKNTTYRIAVKPTTVTNVSLQTYTTSTAALMGAASGGTEWYRSERTDAGAWTDTTTERPLIGLHINGIETGTGGGGASAYAFA